MKGHGTVAQRGKEVPEPRAPENRWPFSSVSRISTPGGGKAGERGQSHTEKGGRRPTSVGSPLRFPVKAVIVGLGKKNSSCMKIAVEGGHREWGGETGVTAEARVEEGATGVEEGRLGWR